MQPYYWDEVSGITIYCADLRDILPKLSLVDAIVTDPPYNIGSPQRVTIDNHGDSRQKRLVGRDFGVFDNDSLWPEEWLPLCTEALKDTGVVVTFYDARQAAKLLTADPCLEPVQDFHWCKPNPPVPMRSVGFSWGTESGYILRKVGFRHRHNDEAGISPNWKLLPRCSNSEDLGHPTQKPLAIMRWLVSHWSFPGDLILDPFCGTGTTLRAAKDLGRRAIGIERDEKWAAIAAKRMSQEAMAL